MKNLIKKIKNSSFIIGIVSLLWLLYKSGTKPSRIKYPCQKVAATNVKVFLFPILSIYVFRIKIFFQHKSNLKLFLKINIIIILIFLFLVAIDIFWKNYQIVKSIKYYKSLRKLGPIGKPLIKIGGTAGIIFATAPHAFSLPSPNRVVSIHNTNATSWHFPCTGSGPCAFYYGDNEYVNQSIVDQMIDKGMMELTGTLSIKNAWEAILPAYQPAEKIAVKVNFNDSIMGGGTSGYGDNDAYVDALPQIINSMVQGLKTMGVKETNIWVFDASRYITDRFRARILYSNIKYFDRFGNGSDVQPSGFSSTDPTAQINFSNSSYGGSHKVTDVLANTDYLINIPIMKRHGGAGITLSLKNHLGSIDGFYTGGHSMHNYIYLSGGNYTSSSNPLADINNNPHIRDKTVLIIGDALYGAWPDNNEPPSKWSSFNDDSPNMLFFSADPVAIDSVMYDYLCREGNFDAKSEDILIISAQSGLGIHERWNNDEDRKYTGIDYIEIDMNTPYNPDESKILPYKNPKKDIAVYPTLINLNVTDKITFIYKDGKNNMDIKICTLRDVIVKEIKGVNFSAGFYEYSTKKFQFLPTGQYILKIGNKQTLFIIIK